MDTTPEIKVLDILFMGEEKVIANYLIESNDGLILIETGPATAFENLKAAIAAEGHNWKEVKHVLLTHIHFDHAGAAWKFADNGAAIYVHPIGLPHLNRPEKLWNSAKRIYKDDMDRLWGAMQPIDKAQLHPLDEGDELSIGDITFHTHYTPGHAVHHNAYQLNDIIFTGDVAGVKINNGPVVPPCPPPDINIEAWKKSINKIRKLNPARLYLAHFGRVNAPLSHLDDLEAMLDDWKNWIKPYYDKGTPAMEIIPEFVMYTQEQLLEKGVSAEDLARYDKGNPAFMSVTGLLRYWKLKEEGRIE